jgi:hypothetical protein
MADSTPSLCPGTGPCSPWALSLACLDDEGDLADACVDGTPVPSATLDAAVLSASQVVWALTGRQYSTCDVTVRPCRRSCADFPSVDDGTGWQGPWPVLMGGAWFNLACQCGSTCSCGDLCEVMLPYPVCEVSEVLVDGVALEPTTYRVDDFRRLVRADGECWPRCQDMTSPDTEEGTWSVSLTYGREPPQIALDAAAELACELIKARIGQACRLPQRMTSLTRQGVSMSFLDPMSFFKEGRTGIYLLDLAIRTLNPNLLMRPPGVYSPDAPSWRVTTS